MEILQSNEHSTNNYTNGDVVAIKHIKNILKHSFSVVTFNKADTRNKLLAYFTLSNQVHITDMVLWWSTNMKLFIWNAKKTKYVTLTFYIFIVSPQTPKMNYQLFMFA